MKIATKKKVYVIGSLANPEIPYFGNRLRKLGFEVYDQWWAAGPLADQYWKHYAKIRGFTYQEALQDLAAKHVFEFDVNLIRDSDAVVMLMKAGKAAHLELGFAAGLKKKCYILLDEEVKRYDIMYRFVDGVFTSEKDLFKALKSVK